MILIPTRPTNCADMDDPDIFFRTDPDSVAAAQQLCDHCWFAPTCREIGKREEHGVWGGRPAAGAALAAAVSALADDDEQADLLYARICEEGGSAVARSLSVSRNTAAKFKRAYEATRGLPAHLDRVKLPTPGTPAADALYRQLRAAGGSATARAHGMQQSTVNRFRLRYERHADGLTA